MKTIAFGFAAALAFGMAAIAAPASAASAQPAGIASHASHTTDFSAQRRMDRRMMRRGPMCETRTVVRRGPMGRRVVTKTRVCR